MKKLERIAIPLGMLGILVYLSHTLLGRILQTMLFVLSAYFTFAKEERRELAQ